MATISIPPGLRDLTDGKDTIDVPGRTVREALANLDAVHRGTWARICEGDELGSFITVVVDGEVSEMGLHQPLQENSEIHLLPFLGGG